MAVISSAKFSVCGIGGTTLRLPGFGRMVKGAMAFEPAKVRSEEEQAAHGVIVHVKDGKPITARGAELLGVPWKENS
jgi:hypothetical protein